jgi:hypothetical protein
MKAASHYAMGCRNLYSAIGPHQIRIPSAKLFEPPANPSSTAKDIRAENIACPLCKHVYDYGRDDVRYDLVQIADQDPILDEPSCISLEFLCDEPGCRAPVRMHTVRAATESKKDVIERLRQSVFHVFCMNYHLLHFPRDQRLIIRIEETLSSTP